MKVLLCSKKGEIAGRRWKEGKKSAGDDRLGIGGNLRRFKGPKGWWKWQIWGLGRVTAKPDGFGRGGDTGRVPFGRMTTAREGMWRVRQQGRADKEVAARGKGV